MQQVETMHTRPTTSVGRIRVFKRRQPRREVPPLDLRTPSGRRKLPY